MNHPNISKPYGGSAIKLKDKLKFIGLGIVLIILVAGCFCGLFYFADVAFDQELGDLFEDLFMTDIHKLGIQFSKLNWPILKKAVLVVSVVLVCLWVVSILIAVAITKKKTVEAVASKGGRLVRSYFSGEDSAEIPFPEEYKELAACVSDVKNQIRHNEQALKDEASKKNDLIAYLAHDLKTPLTSVVGYLSLLEEAPDMPPEQKAKYVHIALNKALRLEQLINEFFEITRYNLHEIVLDKTTVDLSYMLMQMADEFYPVLMERGNTVEVQVEDGLQVQADANKLARVFNNILKNAVAYSDPGSCIRIHGCKKMGLIQIAVSNRGSTIPKQKLQSIFEKFYRLDEARSSNTGGAGLGLAIAKEVVLLHGGAITAESENQVTTFTVLLPA